MWRILRSFATRRVLLTGVGKDRIGIITDLSGLIFSEQGNIKESCMTKLAGDFALMMLLEVPEERMASLQLKLMRSLASLNLTFRDVNEEQQRRSVTEVYTVKVVLKGPDFPGIMHHFSNFLSYSGISIISLNTLYSSKIEGFFSLRSRLQVPQLIKFADLRDKISELAQKDGLQVTMEEITDELV